MKFAFIGTGDSVGVPVWGCDCSACLAAQKKTSLERLAACSAKIEHNGKMLLIDAGYSEMRKRYKPGEIDAVLLTHYHADHVVGLLDIRGGIGPEIPVIGPADSVGFADLFKHPGLLDFSKKARAFEPMYIADTFTVTPVPLNHSKLTFGYLIEAGDQRIAYLCDSCGLPSETLEFLKNEASLDLLVLDCPYPPAESLYKNHSHLGQALEINEALKPVKMVLTHISHQLDSWLQNPENAAILAPNISIASDGEIILF